MIYCVAVLTAATAVVQLVEVTMVVIATLEIMIATTLPGSVADTTLAIHLLCLPLCTVIAPKEFPVVVEVVGKEDGKEAATLPETPMPTLAAMTPLTTAATTSTSSIFYPAPTAPTASAAVPTDARRPHAAAVLMPGDPEHRRVGDSIRVVARQGSGQGRWRPHVKGGSFAHSHRTLTRRRWKGSVEKACRVGRAGWLCRIPRQYIGGLGEDTVVRQIMRLLYHQGPGGPPPLGASMFPAPMFRRRRTS